MPESGKWKASPIGTHFPYFPGKRLWSLSAHFPGTFQTLSIGTFRGRAALSKYFPTLGLWSCPHRRHPFPVHEDPAGHAEFAYALVEEGGCGLRLVGLGRHEAAAAQFLPPAFLGDAG